MFRSINADCRASRPSTWRVWWRDVHRLDNFPLYFYRQPTAPDLQIRPERSPTRCGPPDCSTRRRRAFPKNQAAARISPPGRRATAHTSLCSISTTGRCSGSNRLLPPSKCRSIAPRHRGRRQPQGVQDRRRRIQPPQGRRCAVRPGCRVGDQNDREGVWIDLTRKLVTETTAAQARLLVAAAINFIDDAVRTWHLRRYADVADEITALALSILTSRGHHSAERVPPSAI